MDLLQASRSEKRRSFVTALVLAAVVMMVAAPIAQATHHAVRVKGTVTVKHKGPAVVKPQGGRFDSKAIPEMGLLQAEGSTGALAVRTFGGGGGFLGAADCTETSADGTSNVLQVSNAIVTAIILTGTDGRVTVTSDAVGGGLLPLLNFRANSGNPNEFIGLGNGLTVTAPLTFTGTNEAGSGDGACKYVVLGQ